MRGQGEVKAELTRLDELLKRARGQQIPVIAAKREMLRWVLNLPDPFEPEEAK